MRIFGWIAAGIATATLTACFDSGPNLQRHVLFPAPAAPPGPPRPPPGTERIWLGPADDVEAWFLRPDDAESFPVVVFAHGNAELIDHWGPRFARVADSGIGALLVEYPGYGRSGGSPSEASITQAFVAGYDFVAGQPGVETRAIVGHGRSLGGGAICALSRERRLAALILESTFTSTRAMAETLGFPGSLVVDPFDNLGRVSSFDGPVLVLHGARDRLIPPSHGEQLAEAARTSLERMPCGHNDCPWSWPRVAAFLRAEGLGPTAR